MTPQEIKQQLLTKKIKEDELSQNLEDLLQALSKLSKCLENNDVKTFIDIVTDCMVYVAPYQTTSILLLDEKDVSFRVKFNNRKINPKFTLLFHDVKIVEAMDSINADKQMKKYEQYIQNFLSADGEIEFEIRTTRKRIENRLMSIIIKNLGLKE